MLSQVGFSERRYRATTLLLLLPGGKRALIQVWRTSLLDCTIELLDLATGATTPITEAISGVVVAYR